MGGESWKLVWSASRWVRRAGVPVLALVLSLAILPGNAHAQETEAETALETSVERATHEVRPGDTLWGLAGVYLANSFLWRSIFEINTDVIEDPHWIYPGEMLALPGAGAVAQADAAPTRVADEGAVETLETWDAAQEQGALPATTDQERGRVSWFGGNSVFDTTPEFGNLVGTLDIDVYREPTLVSESDFYRAPLLVDREAPVYQGRTVRKLEGNPLGLRLRPGIQLFDVVMIELDNLDVVEGDHLRAIRWKDVGSERRVGRSIAMLEVLEAGGGKARARVTGLFAEFVVGDVVILAEGYDVSPTLAQAVEQGSFETEIVGYEVTRSIIGEGDMLFLDAGDQDGVRIGDEFAMIAVMDDVEPRVEDRLATIRIVRTTPNTATGRIVDLRDTSPQRMAPAMRTLRAVGN